MSNVADPSDIVFGLFWLLGFQFSPRLAELREARFWRIDPKANYGVLNGLARNRVKIALITQHWDDLLRMALSKWESFELRNSSAVCNEAAEPLPLGAPSAN
jgi:TnpA family transposase